MLGRKKLFLIINLVFFLSGCGNLTRLRECEKLASIGTELANQTMPNLLEKDQEIIYLFQQQFLTTSEQINNENWRDSKILDYSSNLSQIYQEYGTLTQEFISALHRKEREKALSIQTKLNDLGTKQVQIVEEINNYCQVN
ncbi:MAG: hypothetical protein IGQ45_03690 [Cyanobacterium sp. T60_A2020_053]|nr:hypothetical protein [Cyanobacterium sp. T60_A2020_053]